MADWYFRGGPQRNSLKKCPACGNLVRSHEEFCPYCAKRLRAEGGIYSMLKQHMTRPDAMTRTLIAIIAVAFLLQLALDIFLPIRYRSAGGGLFSLLTASAMTYIRMGSNFHLFVGEYHQYWRWVTSCFLHFGLIHILFNCWAFWDLGRLAERLWGWKQVFATFILTGIAGSMTSFLWAWTVGMPRNSAGASGAICGVLGLLLGAYYKNRFSLGDYLGSQLIRWAVMILIFGLVAGADNGAHIGGMVAGGVLGYFLAPVNRSKTPARDSKIWNGLAGLSLVLFLVSVVCALVFFLRGPGYVEALLF